MKELYSFQVKRQVEKEVPHVKKTKDGPVETTKKVKKTIKNRIVISKPRMSDIEDAEFFYGQKYNEFINAGFLTKAMLIKKMGDVGGVASDRTRKQLSEIALENIEAARVIEFFEGAENLSEEQKQELEDAKLKFTETKTTINNYEFDLRGQFNQTADSKAEQKLIEWFIVNFTFFEDEIGDKKDLFPLFDGENYKERRKWLVVYQDEDEEINDAAVLRKQKLFNEAFETLIRAYSLWYNKIAEDQESIDKALKELFVDEEK